MSDRIGRFPPPGRPEVPVGVSGQPGPIELALVAMLREAARRKAERRGRLAKGD